jgi:hypothetical protein
MSGHGKAEEKRGSGSRGISGSGTTRASCSGARRAGLMRNAADTGPSAGTLGKIFDDEIPF